MVPPAPRTVAATALADPLPNVFLASPHTCRIPWDCCSCCPRGTSRTSFDAFRSMSSDEDEGDDTQDEAEDTAAHVLTNFDHAEDQGSHANQESDDCQNPDESQCSRVGGSG
jgi:hypothetical protein